MRKLILAAFAAAAVLFAATATAAVDKDDLDEYGRGIIQDYSDMQQGDPVQWVWIAPGTRLSAHSFRVGKPRNLTTSVDADMEDALARNLPRTLDRAGASGGAPLQVEAAIYWVHRANRARSWIPYAGMHLAQAGVGVELVFRDSSGAIVAKMRHSGREGEALESAVNELIDEIGDFVRAH